MDYIDDFYDFDDANEALYKDFMQNVAPHVFSQYGADQCALDQAFNDWTDSLCKDGVIPEFLYEQCTIHDLSDFEWRKLADVSPC